MSDAHYELVRLTSAAHPLCGQAVPLVRRLARGGDLFLVIRLPSGSSQLIPVAWASDPVKGVAPPTPVTFTVASLRALSRMVAHLHPRVSTAN